MPLTRAVSFKAVVHRGNRVQVPQLLRWQFKMETQQVLRVMVKVEGSLGASECFYARMRRDGRLTLPKLVLSLLLGGKAEEQNSVGCAVDVHLEPVEDSA